MGCAFYTRAMRQPPLFLVVSCLLFSTLRVFGAEPERAVIISVPDQKLAIVENGATIAKFSVSTSRFGVGDHGGTYTTPLGEMEIAQKIGDGAPLGAVFKSRHFTGEVLRPNAAGRDPIVTRILWLRGLEACNSNAYNRSIYIHGTPVEKMIGRPASFGCIRMRSRDVVQVFDMLPVGAKVEVVTEPLHRALAEMTANRARVASL